MGILKWPEPSILHVKHPPANSQRSISLLKLPKNPPAQLEESRSHIAIAQVPSHSVKSANTKSQLSSWYANSHSNVSYVRSPRNTRATSASRAQQYLLSKKPRKRILLVSLRIPTFAPSTP